MASLPTSSLRAREFPAAMRCWERSPPHPPGAGAIPTVTGILLPGFTYNGHPVAVAAGRAVLQRLIEHKLVEAADSECLGSLASAVKEELQKLWQIDCVGDVRGLGLMWAVEFVANRQTKEPFAVEMKFAARVNACAFKRGVMLYPMQGCAGGLRGDPVMSAPPAVITADEIRWAVEQVVEGIAEPPP